uniref:DNA polymerase epsilon catalytic subunit n=1 Tax=Psilocybe cubensis TaxID=181762 RepID=A0A8H7Y3E8_PSICU
MVDESVCAVCNYNRPGKTCDRRLNWAWTGEFLPAHRDEFNMIKRALNQETFPPKRPGGPASFQRLAIRVQEFLEDLLQLAHKCILNSFYGYIMRKGARWHSKEALRLRLSRWLKRWWSRSDGR